MIERPRSDSIFKTLKPANRSVGEGMVKCDKKPKISFRKYSRLNTRALESSCIAVDREGMLLPETLQLHREGIVKSMSTPEPH